MLGQNINGIFESAAHVGFLHGAGSIVGWSQARAQMETEAKGLFR